VVEDEFWGVLSFYSAVFQDSTNTVDAIVPTRIAFMESLLFMLYFD